MFETKEDCTPVEALIWKHISFDYGCEFNGVEKLNTLDLLELKTAIDYQLKTKANEEN